MLTVQAINDLDYYEHLKATEYHVSSGEPAGHWGTGLEQLGLQNGAEVSAKALNAIMLGHDMEGKKITQSAGKKSHRLGHDLTFSAPKGVSILWANASPEVQEKISHLQAEAVKKSLDFLKSKCQARTGKDGKVLIPIESFISATFEHSNTRENDPQLHTHLLLSSTCIREDGKTGTFENSGILKHSKIAGALYRAELANGLKAMGFHIEQDENYKGKGDVFRVAGMNHELEKHFSKRSIQITQKAKETKALFGVSGTFVNQKIALATRKKKETVNRPVNFAKWQAESQERGFDTQALESLKAAQAKPFERPSVEQIFDELTDHESTFSRQDLELKLAEFSQYESVDIEAEIEKFMGQEECIHLVQTRQDSKGNDYIHEAFTSKKMLEMEAKIVEDAKARSGETRHMIDPAMVTQIIQAAEGKNGFTFRDEQRQAILDLTTKAGGVLIFKGKAGAGKTTSLTPAIESYKASGYQVYGATISAKAAQVLQAETGLKTSTIAQTLIDLDKGKMILNSKSLLVIDEVGMLGSREFSRLQNHCDRAGAKLILAGDEQQLQSVGAGGVLNSLQKHGGLIASELTEITRQKDDQEREASRLFSEGKAAEALEIYEARGQIVIEKWRNLSIQKLALDYANDTTNATQKIAITSTNADRMALNHAIREQLENTGKIDRFGVSFENHEGDMLEIARGDRIVFKRNDKKAGIQNNLSGTVQKATQNGKQATLEIMDDEGKIHHIDTQKYNDVFHGYAITAHGSQGSTVSNAYVLFNKSMDGQGGYVAMTRHRQHCQIYATTNDREALAVSFARQNLKGTTLDFAIVEKLPEAHIELSQAPESQSLDQAMERLNSTVQGFAKRHAQEQEIGD